MQHSCTVCNIKLLWGGPGGGDGGGVEIFMFSVQLDYRRTNKKRTFFFTYTFLLYKQWVGVGINPKMVICLLQKYNSPTTQPNKNFRATPTWNPWHFIYFILMSKNIKNVCLVQQKMSGRLDGSLYWCISLFSGCIS